MSKKQSKENRCYFANLPVELDTLKTERDTFKTDRDTLKTEHDELKTEVDWPEKLTGKAAKPPSSCGDGEKKLTANEGLVEKKYFRLSLMVYRLKVCIT